jgi:hypothetical protein
MSYEVGHIRKMSTEAYFVGWKNDKAVWSKEKRLGKKYLTSSFLFAEDVLKLEPKTRSGIYHSPIDEKE